jgi:hypothetical protein
MMALGLYKVEGKEKEIRIVGKIATMTLVLD